VEVLDVLRGVVGCMRANPWAPITKDDQKKAPVISQKRLDAIEKEYY
jgi:hypothetical protein